MKDLYLIENSTVLKNLLGITDEKELDLAEAELAPPLIVFSKKGTMHFCTVPFKIKNRFAKSEVR